MYYGKFGLFLASATALSIAGTAQADQVILDDLIVDGSACIGQDCVNGESFGFDTIRLKENNLRIKAQDTSASASFPTNDWQITFNDSSNGGANKFSIDDIDGGRTPFTLEAGAPSHALYVDDAGRVGVGTNNPVVELHIPNGDSPTLRLEQNGSSGFTPQTWDVAGNETNFFIRDVTNGSLLAFKIKPGAPNDSLFVAADGDIGLSAGTSPTAALHLKRTDGSALMLIEEASSTAAARELLHLKNNGQVALLLEDASVAAGNDTGNQWKIQNLSGELRFTTAPGGSSETEFNLDAAGNLTIEGNFFAASGTQLSVPDYVFEADYQLMPLSEVESFIAQNGHLPNIPSASEINASGLNMTEMQLSLLRKIEELTLYTLALNGELQDLRAQQ